MAERLSVAPDEDLDQIIARLKNYDSKDVVLVLPNDTRALQDLSSFTALRNTARADNITLTIAGGNKTIRALANLLGFTVEKQANPIPRPDISGSFAGSGQGTVVYPDYSGVADGFVATNSDQKFSKPEGGFPTVTPPQPPQQASVQAPMPPAQTQNFGANPPLQSVATPPSQGRQPRPQPGFNLTGNQLNTQNSQPLKQTTQPNSQLNPVTEDRSRGGFFAAPTPELGKMDASFQPSQGQVTNDFEPLPGFLDELVSDDTVAGQFRAKQAQPAPRPKGAFFGRQNQRPFPADEQPDPYDIEEVPDPDSDPVDEAAAAAVFGVSPRPRPAPQPPRPKGRPVTGAVSGPVAQKGGVGAFLLSGDRRTTLTLALAVLFAFLLVIVLFLLLVKPGGVMTLVAPKPQTLTVPLKTELVTNTLRLELLPADSVPPTQGATIPTGTSALPAGTANAAGTPAATAAPVSVAPATLPVEIINTGEIKKSGTTPATGIHKVPDATASGPVAFYNRSFSPKSYSAGTVIYTRNGVSYRLVQGLTIPGSTQFNGQAGQATGQVTADKAGTGGNVNEVVSFPLNENVGVGLGPLTNGTDKDEKFVQQADLDGLKKQLQDQARAEVNNALKYDQSTQGVFVLKTTEPACTFPQKVNDTADTVSGSCTTSLEAARYRTADVVAGSAAHFVTDSTLQLDTQTPLEFIGTPKLVQDQNRNFMEIQVKGRIIHTLDIDAFRTAIAGQPKATAQTVISTDFPEVDTAQLDLKNISGDTSRRQTCSKSRPSSTTKCQFKQQRPVQVLEPQQWALLPAGQQRPRQRRSLRESF